jgi:hypothetical protein
MEEPLERRSGGSLFLDHSSLLYNLYMDSHSVTFSVFDVLERAQLIKFSRYIV